MRAHYASADSLSNSLIIPSHPITPPFPFIVMSATGRGFDSRHLPVEQRTENPCALVPEPSVSLSTPALGAGGQQNHNPLHRILSPLRYFLGLFWDIYLLKRPFPCRALRRMGRGFDSLYSKQVINSH
jgi:hypothetical protein